MPKQLAWEPCPRCHSSRVEIRGVLYTIVIGMVIVIFGAPAIAFAFAAVFGPSAGLVGGAIVGILGALVALTAPLMPKQGHCRDCQKNWQLSQAAA